MSKLPAVRPKDLARVARKLGFVLDRQKGSHAVYLRAADRRRVVIPMHNRDLKPGTLHGLVRDLGISAEELVGLL
jgi:predicted RNA binding protein YcfA (HicA-like mRNA interferase family)